MQLVTEQNLKTASRLFLAEVVIFVAVGLTLQHFGYVAELAMIPLWLCNFVVAWFIAQAAHVQARSRLLFGLGAAMGPPLALPLLLALRNRALFAQLDQQG